MAATTAPRRQIDTDPTPTTVDAGAIGKRISDYARTMPTLQWCKVRLRYGFGYEAAGANIEGLFIAVANEIARRELGRDQWDKFEAMPVDELVAYIEARLPLADALDAPAAADAEDGDPKSVD